MASRTRASLLALAGALALALGLTACGGDEVAELARLAPAHSIAYGEAVIRPEGSRRDSVEAILDRFPDGERAGERLVEAIDAELAAQDLSYREDIEPWLGERAAGALIAVGVRPEGAVFLESTDDDAARALLEEAAEREDDVTGREHEGVSYHSDGEKAAGVVDGALVIATESGMRDVIEAAEGESLAGEEEFADVAGMGDEVFGFAWVNPEGLVDAAVAGIAHGRPQLDPERVLGRLERLGLSDEEPLVARLTATPDAAAFEAELSREDEEERDPAGLLGEMPEDSLLALGIGESLIDAEAQPEKLEERLGFDPLEALEGLGAGGAFLRGRGITDIGAGLAFEVSDRDAVERALAVLRDQVEEAGSQPGALSPGLPGDPDGFSILPADIPFPVTVALTEERLAIAFGPAAAERLLAPEETLEGSDRLADARDALDGLEPALMIDVTRIVGLAETFGLGADPSFQEARDYLGVIREVLAGAEVEGGRLRFRLAVSLTA